MLREVGAEPPGVVDGGLHAQDGAAGLLQPIEGRRERHLLDARPRPLELPGHLPDVGRDLRGRLLDPRGRETDRRRSGTGVERAAGEHAEGEGGVRDRAREAPDVIEAPREGNHALGRHEPVRGLDAHDAAVGGRAQDRPDRLRAERQRDHPRRDRRRRSARRAAGRVLAVPGVARRRGIQVGELRRRGLAEDHRPRRAQAPDRRCVLRRRLVGERAGAGGGRHARDVEDVLDPDGDAVEWPAEPSRARVRRALAGGGPRPRLVDVDPGPERGICGPDPRQADLDQLDRRERALPDAGGRVRDRGNHRRPPARPAVPAGPGSARTPRAASVIATRPGPRPPPRTGRRTASSRPRRTGGGPAGGSPGPARCRRRAPCRRPRACGRGPRGGS